MPLLLITMIVIINKSMALQPRRAKTDLWLLPDGGLVVSKAHPSTLILFFLTKFRYFSRQVATQLSSRGCVDPVPDPILPEKFLGYSRGLNVGPLGWQSDVLTTIPNRR